MGLISQKIAKVELPLISVSIAIVLILLIVLSARYSNQYNGVVQNGSKQISNSDIDSISVTTLSFNEDDANALGSSISNNYKKSNDHNSIGSGQIREGWVYENGTYRPPDVIETIRGKSKAFKRPVFPYEPNRQKLNELLFSKEKKLHYTDEEMDLLFDAAERGTGYDPYDDDNIQSPYGSLNPSKIWHVLLWGRWRSIQEMSGCPGVPHTGYCPYHPNCMIYMSRKRPALRTRAEVLLIPVTNTEVHPQSYIFPKEPREKPYRIGYQREPSWWVPRDEQPKYDMQMSMRINTGIMNPIFFREPSFLFEHGKKNYKPYKERIYFALSIISDCNAPSLRDEYLKKLTGYLGARRIHQYGKCGDGHFLPYNQEKVLAKVSKYKFYFAFENTIEAGYVSEKLGKTLSYGPIPIYYGAPDVPKITRTPSYINVLDYQGPADLAKYLLFLSENEAEYNKYHQWRHERNPFDPEYLKLLAIQRPGAIETQVHAEIQGTAVRANRRAACCRLCNEAWIKRMLETHRHEVFDPPAHQTWINQKIFNGTLNMPINAKLLLKDDSSENDGHDEYSKTGNITISDDGANIG